VSKRPSTHRDDQSTDYYFLLLVALGMIGLMTLGALAWMKL
jgi:hypothetical protein